jgi:hypothetical protein
MTLPDGLLLWFAGTLSQITWRTTVAHLLSDHIPSHRCPVLEAGGIEVSDSD